MSRHETLHLVVSRKEIAQQIKSAREAAGLSQQELGRRAGVCIRSINYWEKERGEPNITAFIRIAQALSLPLEVLAGITTKGPRP